LVTRPSQKSITLVNRVNFGASLVNGATYGGSQSQHRVTLHGLHTREHYIISTRVKAILKYYGACYGATKSVTYT
ncbi:hypothetical protein ABN254_21420, partial [Providencia rettgeri]